MRIELINTGSELMLGRVLNTHQQWLCRQFADRGYTVNRQVAVDDSGPAIQAAVKEAMGRAELIVVTGGLGPTSDDRTRDLIAALLGCRLVEDPAVVAHIEGFFKSRKRLMPASTRIQAMVPADAQVLMNANGTAPGLAIKPAPGEGNACQLLVMLPGPPRELRPMFSDQVVPLLIRQFPLPAPFVCRTLKTTGMGESQVEEKISGALHALTEGGMDLGYCARVGEVDVRFVARGPDARSRVEEAERIVRGILGPLVFAADDEQLEETIVRLLADRKQTLALAESCTGGAIAHRITNVPGASAVLLAGLVTYSNDAKVKFLGVRKETLSAHGAVSEETAKEMAKGARLQTGADFAVSVTGIAGPGGGTAEKPVGTVWIGLASAAGVAAQRRFNAFDRETFKNVTSQNALDWLRRQILGAV